MVSGITKNKAEAWTEMCVTIAGEKDTGDVTVLNPNRECKTSAETKVIRETAGGLAAIDIWLRGEERRERRRRVRVPDQRRSSVRKVLH